jgi:hypothetical protein
MIEAAGPVDAAFDAAGRERPVDHVQNVVVCNVADIQNVGFPEFAEVARLAAGGGIKLCLVEDYAPTGGFVAGFRIGEGLATQDLGRETILKSVIVIQAASRHDVESSIAC